MKKITVNGKKLNVIEKCQQGDVIAYKVDYKFSKIGREKPQSRLVVVDSQNQHVLNGSFERIKDKEIIVQINSDSTLNHNQHDSLVLTKGNYVFLKPVEMGMFNDMVAEVED